MAAQQIDTDRLRELVRLRRMHCSAREIERFLGMSPHTQRRYAGALALAGLLEGDARLLPSRAAIRAAVREHLPAPARQPSSLAPWRPRVEALLRRGLRVRTIHSRLLLEPPGELSPFAASYSALKRLVRAIRKEVGIRPEDVALPVDTAPGEIAQVDLGYLGELYDPEVGIVRRTWVFVFVLGFSRFLFADLVTDQSDETWLRLHARALTSIGGVVETLVPDNTRRAVLRAAFGIDGPCELNRSYRELAQHFGCKVDPAPPGEPRKKGKAEAAVKYVQGALAGCEGEPIPVVRELLARWARDVANVRRHGSLEERPIDLFEREERAALLPLPAAPYELAIWKKLRVHPDSHVAFRGRLYSVPWQLLHEEVWLRATETSVGLFHDDLRVATHARRGPRRSTLEAHLPEDRRELCQRGRQRWEDRAAQLGPETLAYVRAIFDADLVLSQLRRVQAIVRLLAAHPRERAERVSQLGRAGRQFSYGWVKATLLHALDLSPTHIAERVAQGTGRSGRAPK